MMSFNHYLKDETPQVTDRWCS